MDQNITLLPWQSTILIWGGVFLSFLILSMIINMFIEPKKRALKKKFYSIFCLIFLTFVITLSGGNIAAASFLVDVKLGWRLSLAAGASMLLAIISLTAMIVGAFGDMSMKIFWIWMVLLTLSTSSAVSFIMLALSAQ